jgi:hypothetical protein
VKRLVGFRALARRKKNFARLSIQAGSFDLFANQPTGRRRGARNDEETTMQYLLLIYDNEKVFEDMSAAEREKFGGEYFAFTESIKKSGHFRAGDALQPVSTATSVRVKNGKTVTTDGPFAETREQLGGYYLVEAANLDDAIAIAARIPSTRVGGCIEVRPVMVFS